MGLSKAISHVTFVYLISYEFLVVFILLKTAANKDYLSVESRPSRVHIYLRSYDLDLDPATMILDLD